MKTEIKHWLSGSVLFEGHFGSLAEAVVSAVKGKKNLVGANLWGADLRGADLKGAYLKGANLRGANLRGLPPIPKVAQIDSKILAAIEAGGKLNMGSWHECGTTHCRGGWAVTLAGEKGRALEKATSTELAAILIYQKSRPGKPIPDFFASNQDALADIRACAKAEAERAGGE